MLHTAHITSNGDDDAAVVPTVVVDEGVGVLSVVAASGVGGGCVGVGGCVGRGVEGALPDPDAAADVATAVTVTDGEFATDVGVDTDDDDEDDVDGDDVVIGATVRMMSAHVSGGGSSAGSMMGGGDVGGIGIADIGLPTGKHMIEVAVE